MLQFDFITGRLAGTSVQSQKFPYRIGRAVGSDLRLEEEGVWNEHVEIRLENRRFLAEVQPGASLLVNGLAPDTTTLPLNNGDLLTIGVVQLRFGLTPPRQKALGPRECLTWCLLTLVAVGQVALIYWLVAQ